MKKWQEQNRRSPNTSEDHDPGEPVSIRALAAEYRVPVAELEGMATYRRLIRGIRTDEHGEVDLLVSPEIRRYIERLAPFSGTFAVEPYAADEEGA